MDGDPNNQSRMETRRMAAEKSRNQTSTSTNSILEAGDESQRVENSSLPGDPILNTQAVTTVPTDIIARIHASTAEQSPTATIIGDLSEEDDTSEKGEDFQQTPYGYGVNHQLQTVNSPNSLLPSRPTKIHVDICLQNFRKRLTNFGKTFMLRTGWIKNL